MTAKKITVLPILVGIILVVLCFIAAPTSSALSRMYINDSLLMLTIGEGGGLGGGEGGTSGKAMTGENGSFTGISVTSVISNETMHNCVLASSNQVYCAGNDGWGQLGNETVASTSSVPVQFKLQNGLLARAASIGRRQTCALASNNHIYCAGENNYGQLGDGSTVNRNTPIQFSLANAPGGTIAQTVSMGYARTCALTSNNQIYCAGANSGGNLAGALGDGSTTDRSTPVKFNLPTSPTVLTARAMSVGNYHTCALASDNQAYCAGNNGTGRLGNGNTVTPQSTPVKFNLPTSPPVLSAQSIVAGSSVTCALASNNQVYCAGSTTYGKLGNGVNGPAQPTPSKFNLPTSPTVLTAQSVGIGSEHTCVLASNDQVYCTGRNNLGQLGDGSTTDRSTPVKFNLPTSPTVLTARAMSVGDQETCVLASDNQVYCAGKNDYGQLGNTNTTSPQPNPVKFSLSGHMLQAVEANNYGTCALADDSKVYCAGRNLYGRLGDNTTMDRSTPVEFQLP